MSLTRRNLLMLSSGLALSAPHLAFGAPRWATRNPSEWTPEDIDDVLNRSAWVREVQLAMPDPTPNNAGAALGAIPSEYKAVVRWESGLPIHLARRARSRPGGDSGYVLSLSRLPIEFATAITGGAARRQNRENVRTPETAAAIAKTSTLQREGKTPLPATRAEWWDADVTSRLMLYFEAGQPPIQLADKEVALVSTIGSLRLVARFYLKQMVYRGKLEI